MCKSIKKLNRLIERKGYTLKNLPPIWQDKYTSLIWIILIIKAILNLFGLEKTEKAEENVCPFVTFFTAKPSRFIGKFHEYFLVNKFATSL